ncbi:hypothetical protein ALT_8765 [Aspergillus lentulus]|uniref:Uncharacterized protein n=1 Tax=Aspergillus lentulus TaxID=293939 RepID=A0AAN4PS77_ASPLE|nr:hypothetical protein ALT_8765 [Aspergillus lentulus]
MLLLQAVFLILGYSLSLRCKPPLPFYDISIGYYTKSPPVSPSHSRVASEHPEVATFQNPGLPPLCIRYYFRSKSLPDNLVSWSWLELIVRVKKTLGILAEAGPEEAESKSDDTKLPMQVGPEENGAHAFLQVPHPESSVATGLPETLCNTYIF